MTREITHKPIVEFHRAIAAAHIEINGFYRFNWNEINGMQREGTDNPCLLLESHSSEMSTETKNVTNFNARSISFLLLDFAGETNDYDKQEDVLDRMENIGLDICAYLVKESNTRSSWLFGKFDSNSFQMMKIGPIFGNMFGWNVLYNLKNHESMNYDPVKWDWPL